MKKKSEYEFPWENDGRVKAKDDDQFVMKNLDCDKWVARTTPMEQTENPSLAVKFSAGWIKSTCWNWEIFYVPVSEAKHALVVKAFKDKEKQELKRLVVDGGKVSTCKNKLVKSKKSKFKKKGK